MENSLGRPTPPPLGLSSSSESDAISTLPEVILLQLRALQLSRSTSAADATPERHNSSEPFLQQQQQLAQQRPQRHKNEQIRCTVYINELDRGVNEQELAALFALCGTVVDCRVCGNPKNATRFGFVEFSDAVAARRALALTGAVIRGRTIRVFPSTTAIQPINGHYLPRCEEEREAVDKTVYVSNIHCAIERNQVHAFFYSLCGPITKIKLLGDGQHQSKIAFVEFCTLEGAALAVKCSGVLLGLLPLRVTPSKTPIRPEKKKGREGVQHGQLQPKAHLWLPPPSPFAAASLQSETGSSMLHSLPFGAFHS